VEEVEAAPDKKDGFNVFEHTEVDSSCIKKVVLPRQDILFFMKMKPEQPSKLPLLKKLGDDIKLKIDFPKSLL
jgi:hypothetical protein